MHDSVTPLRQTWVTPNHLTTLRLAIGLGAAWAFTYGTYGRSNLAALGERPGERRVSLTMEYVSLTMEYVTDSRMHAGWRVISKMKDAIAYFGFRQVFRR